MLTGTTQRETNGTGTSPKETVWGILTNRFYLGEIPDGNSGWQQGKHQPMISQELFEAAEQARLRNGRIPGTINQTARTYSFSCLMRSMKCGSRIRPKGRPRVYCAGRADGLGCTCRGTFLDVYEQHGGTWSTSLSQRTIRNDS